MSGPHASMYFKNGKVPKTLMKTRKKRLTGLHAFVHFKNGQNAKNDLKPTMQKNAHEIEKIYNRATCLCVFRKWAKCQKCP